MATAYGSIAAKKVDLDILPLNLTLKDGAKVSIVEISKHPEAIPHLHKLLNEIIRGTCCKY